LKHNGIIAFGSLSRLVKQPVCHVARLDESAGELPYFLENTRVEVAEHMSKFEQPA
jgi:hypothetical protein